MSNSDTLDVEAIKARYKRALSGQVFHRGMQSCEPALKDIPALLSERERLIGEVDRRHGIGGELIIARRERDEAVARALKAEAEVERITNRWMDACDREAQQSALIEKLAGALRTVQGIAYPLAWAGIAGHDSIVRVVDPALAAIPKSETPDRG